MFILLLSHIRLSLWGICNHSFLATCPNTNLSIILQNLHCKWTVFSTSVRMSHIHHADYRTSSLIKCKKKKLNCYLWNIYQCIWLHLMVLATVGISHFHCSYRKITHDQKRFTAKKRALWARRAWLDSGFCSSCEGLLRGSERGGVERFGEIPGILHKLIGISNVCQAKPEDGPCAINKAAIRVLKVPAWTRIGQNQH